MMNYHILLFAVLAASATAQRPGGSTTTDASSSSTTPATSTTSPSPQSTTTQSPVVPPSPPVVPTWTAKSSNSTCVLLRGNFTFALTYTTPDGNSASTKVDIPTTAKTSGNCGAYVNSLALTWDQGNLTFVFIKRPVYDAGVDTGTGSWSLTTVFGMITVMNPNDPNGANNGMNGGNSPPGSASSGQSFYISLTQPAFMSSALHNSYTCNSYQSVAADRTGNAYLEMSDVQIEAFHDSPTPEFSPSQPCTKDTVSSVMAIVGYAALGALVAAALGYAAWKTFGRAGYTQV